MRTLLSLPVARLVRLYQVQRRPKVIIGNPAKRSLKALALLVAQRQYLRA